LQGGADAVIVASQVISGVGRQARTASVAEDGGSALQAKLSEKMTAAGAAAASSRILSRLLTLDDVLGAVEEASELATSIKRGRVPPTDALRPVLAKLAQMSTVGNFADTISGEGGSASLVAMIQAIIGKVRVAAFASCRPFVK
jgi:hypothetical protein